MKSNREQTGLRTEINDFLRGSSGAFLFGVPFLFTMEVWWKGNFTSVPRMIIALLLTYLSLLALNRFEGFRKEGASPWSRTILDSFEGLAIALVSATVGLFLIRVLTFEAGLQVTLGRIVMETVPFGIGVGITNTFLYSDENQEKGGVRFADHAWKGTLLDAAATVFGATIIAFNIAPTDEIPKIASGMSPLWLLVIIAASLGLSYIIVFEANFGSQEARMNQPGIFQSPITETVISYLLSLLMAAGMLWLFQLVRTTDPLEQWVSYAIVLGLPSSLGGAAGRLAL